jgi:UDPglucose 6-dehydrogenase
VKISVVGTGYVGLVSGVCFAEQGGHSVVCVDVDKAKVDSINRGVPPIHEAGLDEMLKRHAGKSLVATLDLESAVLGSDITFIAAGTPFDGREIDLKFVKQIASEIGAVLKKKAGYHVVVVKSTVVPGTTDNVVLPLLEKGSGKKAGKNFGVGMNPEFLSEGVAVADFMNPDRIVLGGIDGRTQDALADVYARFGDEVPRLRTTNATAEMIKYGSNALQATMISFANEVANLCSTIGNIDATDVMKGVHLMKELTPAVNGKRHRAPIAGFAFPGCGFGGSCFPKDLKAIVAHGQKLGAAMPLLQSVVDVNLRQPERMIELLKQRIPSLKGVRVCVLGLAFKPDTDDMRESPAIPIVKRLVEESAVVRAVDPIAVSEARKLLPKEVELTDDLRHALDGAAGVLLVTNWEQFKAVPDLLCERDPQPFVVDGRRFLAKDSVAHYTGIGL